MPHNPAAMALTAFICEVPHPFVGAGRYKTWAAPRCRVSRVVEGETTTHVAGVLLHAPSSLRHFQRLWVTNLKNWDLSRLPYKRGAIRLVTLAQYRAEIGPTETALTLCSQVVGNLLATTFAEVDRRAKQRTEDDHAAEIRRRVDERMKEQQAPEAVEARRLAKAARAAERRELEDMDVADNESWHLRRSLKPPSSL